ncbi:MAG TPA: hypothetical protein VFS97_01835 [Nitrososphaeraceae archaeon]|nr:hypothetical protein [Nitrososphaeraceae archaeon]
MGVSSDGAEKVVNDVLSTNKDILAITIMDMGGNPLAAKSKEPFKEAFGAAADWHEYGGTLALATLSLVNQVRNVFGEAQAIISVHKNCKLMLLAISSYQILVGLVLERSHDEEDLDIANKIERLMADMLNRNGNL